MSDTATITSFEIAELRSQIDRAAQAYYAPGCKPIISDAEYDALVANLREISPEDPRLSQVGPSYSYAELRNKVEHRSVMGSLDNMPGGIDGFSEWYTDLCDKAGKPVDLILSHKLDGNSIELVYEGGKLVQASTRGNGIVGDDITANAVLWQGVPTTLPGPFNLVVRGEVMLFTKDFQRLNEGLEGDDVHANPRNLCNGIIGRKDGEDNQSVRFLAFNVIEDKAATMQLRYALLKKLGFDVVPHWIYSANCGDMDQHMRANYEDLEAVEHGGHGRRSELDYEIDGLVVTADDLSIQRALTKEKRDELRPKFARAIKFVSFAAVTTVIGCEITEGHDGSLAPTAKLEPVRVGGVTVSSALLNNWNEDSENLSAAHVAIGDQVEVALAGDIIPKIIRIVTPAPGDRQTIPEPMEWKGRQTTRMLRGKRSAKTFVILADDDDLVIGQKVSHYIGSNRKGIGILGIGDGVLKALIDPQYGRNGIALVRTPADLYRLTIDQIANLPIGKNSSGGVIRVGTSRAEGIHKSINDKRQVSLPKFMGALGIELLGERLAEELIKSCGLATLEDWMNPAALQRIPGDVRRATIIEGIEKSKALINDLLSVGVTISEGSMAKASTTAAPVAPSDSGQFVGTSWCFTGTRECLDDVAARGGVIKSGVSKGLTYLVQKDPTSVSNKTQKAEEYGVKIVGIEYLKKILAGEAGLP